MHRLTPLLPPRADGRHIGKHALLLGLVRARRQLDQAVQRHLHPRALLLRRPHEVRVDAPQHRLVRDDEDVLAALQLHDDGLQPDDDVAVALPAQVAVVVLVLVPRLEVRRVFLLDLGVRQAVADAAVELVERFPREFLVGQVAGRLGGAFEGRGPDGEGQIAGGFFDEGGEDLGVALAAWGEVRVAADLAREVVVGFAVLGKGVLVCSALVAYEDLEKGEVG